VSGWGDVRWVGGRRDARSGREGWGRGKRERGFEVTFDDVMWGGVGEGFQG
jgi:hypothetical protein